MPEAQALDLTQLAIPAEVVTCVAATLIHLCAHGWFGQHMRLRCYYATRMRIDVAQLAIAAEIVASIAATLLHLWLI